MTMLPLGDHPRIRGEHGQERQQDEPVYGIIPAYAGSTGLMVIDLDVDEGSSPHTRGARRDGCDEGHLRQDHPRIRGEHVIVLFEVFRPSGIIPAYAGSTCSSLVTVDGYRGSSPHTRGALSGVAILVEFR